MRKTIAGVVVVLLVVGGAMLFTRRDRVHQPGLIVDPGSLTLSPPTEAEEDRAMLLAVASLTTADRKELLEAMDYATARLEAQLAPLADDLGEGDPVEELEKKTRTYLPPLTAARSLVRARVVKSCSEAELRPGQRCVPLWAAGGEDSEDAERDRARFIAWGASQAYVFEVADPAACAALLRPLLRAPHAVVALVLTRSELSKASVPERSALEDSAHRLGRAMAANERKPEERKQLEALGRSPSIDRPVPWLDDVVNERTVVVVPRLSALARVAELRRLIETTCTPSRWIH